MSLAIPTYAASGPLGSLTRFRRDPLDLLMSGFRELGDVVRFRLFTRDLVLVAHPNDVRRVLQEHTGNYNKQTRGFEVLRAFLRKGLLTSEGDHWLRQRRIAQPAFHRTRIAGFGDAMAQAASDMVDRFEFEVDTTKANEFWQDEVARNLEKKAAEDAEIAAVARFLISDDASFIAGAVINANGGAAFS